MSGWDYIELAACGMAATGLLYFGYEIFRFGRLVFGL